MTYADQEWRRIEEALARTDARQESATSLLACLVFVLPVAVVAVWLLGHARDVVRREGLR